MAKGYRSRQVGRWNTFVMDSQRKAHDYPVKRSKVEQWEPFCLSHHEISEHSGAPLRKARATTKANTVMAIWPPEQHIMRTEWFERI